MVRKKIQLEVGAILPTAWGLWGTAAERLGEAKLAISSMETARSRTDYEVEWSRFVDALQNFWTRFEEEGKSKFTNFQPWAGVISARRSSEPLLQYLYQARHQAQHGNITLNWEEQHLRIAAGFNGHIRDLKIYLDGTFEMTAIPTPNSTTEAVVTQSFGKALLAPIVNKRHRQTFPQPSTFAGVTLTDLTPIGVARVAVDFYDDVLEQAHRKFRVDC